MRGILIDPFEQSLKEVDVADAGLQPFYKLLNCDIVQEVGVGQGVVMICDEEGKMKAPELQRYFTLVGFDDKIAGRAVLVGRARTKWSDLPAFVNIRLVAPKIVWESENLYASGITTEVEERADGSVIIRHKTQYDVMESKDDVD